MILMKIVAVISFKTGIIKRRKLRRLYIKITKYIYSLSWNKDMDKYLIHLNLNLDITVYSNKLYAYLYKYYLYIMVEI